MQHHYGSRRHETASSWAPAALWLSTIAPVNRVCSRERVQRIVAVRCVVIAAAPSAVAEPQFSPSRSSIAPALGQRVKPRYARFSRIAVAPRMTATLWLSPLLCQPLMLWDSACAPPQLAASSTIPVLLSGSTSYNVGASAALPGSISHDWRASISGPRA